MKGYEYKRLKGRIKTKYDTQKAFAKAMGVSENTVTNKLKGRVGFSQGAVEAWASKLDIERREYGDFFYT